MHGGKRCTGTVFHAVMATGGFALRTTTLAHDPELENVTMETLVCIANAIERESVRRYERL